MAHLVRKVAISIGSALDSCFEQAIVCPFRNFCKWQRRHHRRGRTALKLGNGGLVSCSWMPPDPIDKSLTPRDG